MTYTSVYPNEITLYVKPAVANGSSLASSDSISGEMSNWKVTGFNIDKDVVNVFGGQIEYRKPRAIGEVTFDIVVSNTAASTIQRWQRYDMGTGNGSDLPTQESIFIQALSNGNYFTYGFKTCDITQCEASMTADEYLKLTIAFKCAAVTQLGVSQVKSSSVAASSAFFTWS